MSPPSHSQSLVLRRPPPLFLPLHSAPAPAKSDNTQRDPDGNEGVQSEKHGPAIEEEAIHLHPQQQQHPQLPHVPPPHRSLSSSAEERASHHLVQSDSPLASPIYLGLDDPSSPSPSLVLATSPTQAAAPQSELDGSSLHDTPTMPHDGMDIDSCPEAGDQQASEISIISHAPLAVDEHRVEIDRVAGVSGSEVDTDGGSFYSLLSTTPPLFVLNRTLHRLLLPPLITNPSVQLSNLFLAPPGRPTTPTHVQAPALAPPEFTRGSTPQHVVMPPGAAGSPENLPLRTASHSPRLLIEYPGPPSTTLRSPSPAQHSSPGIPATPIQDQSAQRTEPEPRVVDPAPSPEALSPVLESGVEVPESDDRETSPAEAPRQAAQVSPKKRQLNAVSPAEREPRNGVDVFTSGWGGGAGKRQKTVDVRSEAEAETETEMVQDPEDGDKASDKGGEAVETAQWKVGKTPGHQGSHSRAARRTTGEGAGESEGKKRSLSESISGAAERVLKKPFRPPTRISLPASRPKTSPRYPASSPASASAHAASATLVCPDGPSSPTFPEFKSSPLTFKTRSAKLARPFKTPIRADRADRSTAPSPSTTSSTHSARFPFPLNLNTSSSTPITPCAPTAQAAQATITSLQNEILLLRKALKYDTEDSRGRLEVLITQWRAAGREMVERLFGIIPQPIDSLYNAAPPPPSANAYAFSNPTQGYPRSPFWDDLPTTSSRTDPTPEMRNFLAHARRNDDGELVDDEGVSLVPDVREDDLERMFERLRRADEAARRAEASPSKLSHRPSNSSSSKPHTSYTSSSRLPEVETLTPTSRDHHDLTSSPNRGIDAEDNGTTSTAWDYAALMRGLGVDPPLLGWDARAEDWADLDE